jgi:transglutaminase-like putative cysteine protease
MTRINGSVAAQAVVDDASEDYDVPWPFTPREGWLSLIALALMMVVVAVAIDDALWAGYSAGTHASQTGFLPAAALASVLLGAYLAKTTLSTRRINLIGVFAGAVALLFFVSNAISRAPTLGARLHDLNLSVSVFVHDVFVLGTRSTESSIFLLIMGAIVWGAGLFCAIAIFRRHRPLPAIALSGALLMLNVLLTVREQYLHLLVFAAAALLLVVRLNLREQADGWRLRGTRNVGEISASFMRGGAVLVGAAVIASSILATNASSAPLARAWSTWDDDLLNFGYTINRWLGGVTGSARGPNVLFTPSQTIRDFWQSSSEEVFTATISDNVGRRWRGATYDSFDGRSWQQLDRQAKLVAAGDMFLAGTREAVARAGREEISVEVMPIDYGGDVFVAPAQPLDVSQPTEITTRGADGAFVSGSLTYGIDPGVSYTVHSLVRAEGSLTASQLAAAGTEYPSWVGPYRDVRPGSISDAVYETADQIVESLPSGQRDPYHIALAIQEYLYSEGNFTYSTDLRGECGGENLLDCFMRIKKGYCEYFATAMAMMLRAQDIPARYVLGYLPGQQQEDGTWRVTRGAAHAWVEVYFPNYGWVEFDPTPGNTENGQAPTRLPIGEPLPVGSPVPGSPNPQPTDDLENCRLGQPKCLDPEPGAGGGPTASPGGGPPSTVLVVGLMALLVAALVAWLAWRRIPLTQPELAYSGITRLASRLGYAPRPSQTTYEYAAHLADLVPAARPDLELLATAKVEAVYGRRLAGSALLQRIAAAYRHARTGLLRLVFKRLQAIQMPAMLRRGKDNEAHVTSTRR